ncbi:hypothetical protein F2Q68_00009447 [Brassica cretica]|uniref:Peroxin-7 n=1 Tax=Brassica cretica TaxID=69181 RepID=A0A8S9KSD7_BRACR|nr:hypothetical protein F2Q68_00009447 [Brassica cretica]
MLFSPLTDTSRSPKAETVSFVSGTSPRESPLDVSWDERLRSSCGTHLESVSTRSPTKVRDIRIGCCVRFSPNKLVPTIVSASWDQTVKVWNHENCKIRNTLIGHSGYLNNVALSPDSSMCASGGKDGAVLLWDMAEGKTLCSLEAGSIIHSL